MRYMLQFIMVGGIAAAVLIGWTWLLHFPWDWAVKAMCYLQLAIILLLLYMEYDASSIDGAAGWASFGFFFLELFLFAALAVIRLAVLIFELFFVVAN